MNIITSVPAEMPNHALPPATKTETTSMMTVMRVLVAKPRRMVACMLWDSASRAACAASSKRPRS